MIIPMARPGAVQRGRHVEYDPSTGRPWRTTLTLEPDLAAKLILAHKQSRYLSVSGVLNELVRRMDVDEDGRPSWVDEIEPLWNDEEDTPYAKSA